MRQRALRRRLEDGVGLALVHQTTRRVMTEAGEMLVARPGVAGDIDAAHAELQALRGVQTGHVTVGAMHTMGPIDVALVMAILHERHLAAEVTVAKSPAKSSRRCCASTSSTSLSYRSRSGSKATDSALHQLVSEELVVIMPPNHRLAKRRRVHMSELG